MGNILDYCSLVRSKNAGPFELTFDFMFKNLSALHQVQKSGVFTKSMVNKLFGTPEQDILLIYHEAALALKISIPRPVFQGEISDADCYGGQQYVPFLNLEIADE
jgi:hypothetical protein